MNRRSFLLRTGAAAAAAAAWPARNFASGATSAELHLTERTIESRIPITYSGLSFELAQLSEPEFFSAANEGLIAHCRTLSANGVLRLGGNSSEFCWFQADASTPEPKLHVPPGDLAANWMPHRLFRITPQAIDNLAAFLKATGWRLIYGINFGNNTPERAAVEAAYVASKLSDRLEFFQVGNEPDLYRRASNGTRPPGWDFDDYVREWTGFARAISARVPGARFGGPDVAGSSDWITRFGEQMPPLLPGKLTALTGHYYASGPPNDPSVTIERLLRGNPRIAEDMKRIMAVAQPRGLAYRMTEGNSCYRGGKPGMSDAFASALWAGDYMLELASLGCSGVNFHGGSGAFLSASLGDHTPGMDVAKKPQTMRAGYYTPIRVEPGTPVKAMPIFYGIMMANQLAGGTLLDADLSASGVNATAYAARIAKTIKVAIFNKDATQPLDLDIQSPSRIRSASAWRLEAPALGATEGVTLAGSEVDPQARWSPRTTERPEAHGSSAQIHVPAASGALVLLET
ncbi:MAG TPA: glycosyl hydrolase family 79 C-terminal domain-containing protein [Terracidiphilus sp.]